MQDKQPRKHVLAALVEGVKSSNAVVVVPQGLEGDKTWRLKTLQEICLRVLQQNVHMLPYIGKGIPHELLIPILEACTPTQLIQLEFNAWKYDNEVLPSSSAWKSLYKRRWSDSEAVEKEEARLIAANGGQPLQVSTDAVLTASGSIANRVGKCFWRQAYEQRQKRELKMKERATEKLKSAKGKRRGGLVVVSSTELTSASKRSKSNHMRHSAATQAQQRGGSTRHRIALKLQKGKRRR